MKKNQPSPPVSDTETSASDEDLEFATSLAEAQLLRAPKGARWMIWLTGISVVTLLGWSLFAPIDEVVKAQGKVVPSSRVQMIQSLEGGILASLKVDEGQRVNKGDLLVEIRDAKARSDLAVNVSERSALTARLNRLHAFQRGEKTIEFDHSLDELPQLREHEEQLLKQEWATYSSIERRFSALVDQRNQELEQAKNQLVILQRGLALKRKERDLNKPLVKRGAISEVAYLAIQENVNQLEREVSQAKTNVPKANSALEEAKQQRNNSLAEFRQRILKERSEVEERLNSSFERSSSLEDRVARTRLRSPIDGAVQNIEVTTEGGVIRPGAPIMTIVPSDDQLIVKAKIKPKDIGFIQSGLLAKVKITAFDFSRFGGLKGEVKLVSADTTTDKKGNSYYDVRIHTDSSMLKDRFGEVHQILPGMKTEADIVVSQTSVARYILKPLMK